VGRLHLLRDLFRGVLITSGVKREVVDVGVDLGYEDAFVVRRAVEEGWLMIRDVSGEAVEAVEMLVRGENVSVSDAETLLCARESGAEVVLVDERVLSELARMYGFGVWSTWTILLEALGRGLIGLPDVEAAIAELAEHRHKLSDEQAAEILEAARLVASEKR